VNSKLIIAKDNTLIRARYSLSVAEQRVILLCIAKIDSRKAHGGEFELSATELHKETGVSRENAYRDLRAAVDSLYSRTIILESDSELRWLYQKAFFKNKSTAVICFSPPILALITELKERFTSYRLKDVANFKCVYSLRFYEIFVQWQIKNSLTLSVDELRHILQLDDKYPRISDFKKYVINPSLAEINKYSNIKASVSQEKTGKEITHLTFKYSISGVNETNKTIKISKLEIEEAARPGESYADVEARLKRTVKKAE